MKYTLGLDIGAASIGWAVLCHDEQQMDFGVHIFPASEARSSTTAKLTTPATPRRQAKSARRRLRRSAYRREKAKELFVHYALIPDLPTTEVRFRLRNHPAFLPGPEKPSPWTLRAKAPHELLTGDELARALLHIIKRRGFKSSRKGGFDLYGTEDAAEGEESGARDDKSAADEESFKAGVRAMAKSFRASNYQTIGEYLVAANPQMRLRNREKSYRYTVYRDLLEDEVRVIFDRQRALGSTHASPELERDFIEKLLYVRPALSAEDIQKRVGRCTIFRDEKRSPKNTYTAERFMLLGKINALTYWAGPELASLTEKQRAQVVDLAYEKRVVLYSDVRKVLGLPADARFKALNYRGKRTKNDQDPPDRPPAEVEKRRFVSLPGFHTLRAALVTAGAWNARVIDTRQLDTLANALFYHKNEMDLRNALNSLGVGSAIAEAVCNALPEGLSGTSHFSHKALEMLLPYLEKGAHVHEACEQAGLVPELDCEPRNDGKILPEHLPPDVVINPIAHRALARCRKLVNAIRQKYGLPQYVHIELARDLSRGVEQRAEEHDRMQANEEQNLLVDEQIRSYGALPHSAENRRKYKAWRVQEGKCAYCQQPLDAASWLNDPSVAEFDHVLPKSQTFDSSPPNLLLVHTGCNKNKGIQLPYNFVRAEHPKAFAAYCEWAKGLKDKNRQARLLKTSFSEAEQEEWQKRYLHDTRTVTRAFAQVLEKNLFQQNDGKRHVVCFQGRIIAEARKWWGLPKERSDSLHHAVDAVVVASLRHHQIDLIRLHAQVIETRQSAVDPESGDEIKWEENTNKKPRLPLPWKGFKEQFFNLWHEAHQPPTTEPITRVFESRLPRRRMAGQMHDATLKPERKKAAADIKIRGAWAGAAPGSLLRLDVYRVPARGGKTQFQLVPLYVKDFLAAHTPTGEGEYYMTLYKDELVRVVTRNMVVVGYLQSANGPKLKITPLPSDDTITSRQHLRTSQEPGTSEGIARSTKKSRPLAEPSTKTASRLEKFAVTILGDAHPVKRCTFERIDDPKRRYALANRGNHKSREASG